MATIRTTCPSCGEVDLGPASITLKTNHGMKDGVYRFTCPGCASIVEKYADRKVIGLLAAAGVAVDQQADQKPDPRGYIPPSPVLTLDDAISFHSELEDPDVIARFLSG